jgi:hypothetical protein
LTFSSPLIRTTNTISLNQSLIDFNNLLNKPDMILYLLKSGGTMTGNLGIGTTPCHKLHIDSGSLYISGNISNPGNTIAASLWNQVYGIN